MKKLSVILLLAAAFTLGLSAAPLIQLGGYASYNNDILTVDDDEDISFSSFTIGPEARVNLLMFSLDVPATVGFTSKGDFTASLMPSINLSASATSLIDLAVGIGIQMDVTKKDGDWYINGHDTDEFSNNILGLTPFYRLALTFNAGTISIGAALTMESSGTFDSMDWEPDWDQARGSVSVLWNFL